MKSIRTVMILICLSSCHKESGEEVYLRIKGGQVFSIDSAYTVHDDKRALNPSTNSQAWHSIQPSFIASWEKRLRQHQAEYPSMASKYDGLLTMMGDRRVLISEGTVYMDPSTGDLIKETLKRSRWVKYSDYASNRFPEYQLDTVVFPWTRFHSPSLGGDLSIPGHYSIQRSETDTGLSLQLSFVDTATRRYHLPYTNSQIYLFATRTANSFDSHLKTFRVDRNYYESDYLKDTYYTYFNGQHEEKGLMHDSLGVFLALRGLISNSHYVPFGHDQIWAALLEFGIEHKYFFYGHQRLITAGDAQVLQDIIRSFRPTSMH